MYARRLMITLVTLLLTAATAIAGVTIEGKSSMSGFLGMEAKTVTKISGDKQVVDNEMKIKLPLLGSKKLRELDYTRLDKGVVWKANPKEKEYSETSIEEQRRTMQAMQEMMASGGSSDESKEEQEGPFDENVKMNPPVYSFEKTGESDKIAGREADQWHMLMSWSGVNVETGDTVRLDFNGDFWVTEDMTDLEEAQEFNKKYTEALGVEASQVNQMLQGMSRYGVNSEEVKDQLSGMKGYPLKAVISLDGLGQLTGDDENSEQQNAEAMAEAKKAMKKLGGLFGGGNDDEAEDEESADGPTSLMSLEYEVTKISTGGIDEKDFELDPKWKKTDQVENPWMNSQEGKKK